MESESLASEDKRLERSAMGRRIDRLFLDPKNNFALNVPDLTEASVTVQHLCTPDDNIAVLYQAVNGLVAGHVNGLARNARVALGHSFGLGDRTSGYDLSVHGAQVYVGLIEMCASKIKAMQNTAARVP